MLNSVKPESVGISSKNVTKFIKTLEKRGLVTHSVLLMRGNDIFAECYWKPFSKDFCHRMYSQTKSYVAVAIGLLEEDGKLCLDSKIVDLFPEKIDSEIPEHLKKQTVREMLTMQTCGDTPLWFYFNDTDRTHLYLNNNTAKIPSGMRFKYDSPGSQVLSSLVEKLSGKSLFDFLNERIFKYLGTFKTATILKTPNGDSFGDSALLCTSRDMASFARFVMNYGTFDGKRLMNESYLKTATSRIVDNNVTVFSAVFSYGYGYQFWRCQDGFAFNGMGAQLTLCLPQKDLIFVITSDNQGYSEADSLILTAFYDIIVDNLSDTPLPDDTGAYEEFVQLKDSLELRYLVGNTVSNFSKDINCKKYFCQENSAGITEFSFEFSGENEGKFKYKNSQGEKVINFGLGKNVFGKFPQLGYSNEVATEITTDGFMYDCAASAIWCEEQKLSLKIQIIDKYFGNMFATFSFKDNYATVTMRKTAEAFLDEYQGEWVAKKES